MAVLDDLGRSNFELLQDRARARRWREGLPFVTSCAFDLLVHRGKDCRGWPLIERKEALAELLADQPPAIL